MISKEAFYSLINNTVTLDLATQQELKSVVEEYPYFQSARLLYTKNLFSTDKKRYESELSRTALFCADRRKLFYQIKEEEYRLFINNLRAAVDEPDRTQALLDSFLTSLDEHELPLAATHPDLHIVSTDYLTYLDSIGASDTSESTKEIAPMKHQDIIDSFIEKAATDEIFSPTDSIEIFLPKEPDNEHSNDSFLSETLVRIYIKQKKYEQAMTIIKRLSLNFPKKSIYFADQIRFLDYLIQNEKKKNK